MMQLFQCFRTTVQELGILPSNLDQKFSFNSKNLMVLTPLIFCAVSTVSFMLFEADSIQDYEDSYLVSGAICMATINFSINAIWKIRKMLKMIESCEKIVGKSNFPYFFPSSKHNVPFSFLSQYISKQDQTIHMR